MAVTPASGVAAGQGAETIALHGAAVQVPGAAGYLTFVPYGDTPSGTSASLDNATGNATLLGGSADASMRVAPLARLVFEPAGGQGTLVGAAGAVTHDPFVFSTSHAGAFELLPSILPDESAAPITGQSESVAAGAVLTTVTLGDSTQVVFADIANLHGT